jgi:hypothetical protein
MKSRIFFILIFFQAFITGRRDRIIFRHFLLSAVKTALEAVWPANRTINLVFHGHSVPAGYWHDHEVHTLESYPYLTLKKLKTKYPYSVINIIVTAIGGENSVKGQTMIFNCRMSTPFQYTNNSPPILNSLFSIPPPFTPFPHIIIPQISP